MSGSIGHKAKEIFVCPLCQVENRATAKFCRKCGKTRAELDRVGKREGVIAPEGTGDPLTFVYSGPPPLEPETDDEAVARLETGTDIVAQPDAESATQLESESIAQLDAEQAAQPSAAWNAHPDAERVSPQCPSCHTGLRATDKFCSWCGEFQPNRYNPYLKICPGCDQSLPHRANYCFGCGRDVGVHPRIPIRVPVELFNQEDSEFFPTFDA